MPAAAESPAIQKMGLLFRLTEVHLWDDSCAAGASDGQKNWRSQETGFAGSLTDMKDSKTSTHTDEGHLFVEDLELANLMGSLGLPVSFSTSKVKKNTANKGKIKRRQAPYEAASTQINNAVRICVNSEDREIAVQSMAVLEHTNSCSSSGIALGYNETYHDDTDKMRREGSPLVEEQGESGSTICSAEKGPGYEAENRHEPGTCKLPDNMGNQVKPESSIQENQAVDTVLQLSEEMLGHNSVEDESKLSSFGIFEEEILSTREVQNSVETLSIPDDNNDVGRDACLSSAEPSSVDGHAQCSDNNFCYDYGDWKVFWDSFYSRYYFYNIQTQESTWCPPEGLEDFASYCSADSTKGLVELESQYTSIAVQENSAKQIYS